MVIFIAGARQLFWAWKTPPLTDPQAVRQMKEQASITGLAALAGVILLGAFLIAVVWVGARITRRYMRAGDQARDRSAINPDDWSSRPRR